MKKARFLAITVFISFLGVNFSIMKVWSQDTSSQVLQYIPDDDFGLMLKSTFDVGPRSAEIFDWLMKNGYFKEKEGDFGHPKPLTDQTKEVLQKNFPSEYRLIIKKLSIHIF